jgi:glycosyltransferase involved in cell wall biosynthesis
MKREKYPLKIYYISELNIPNKSAYSIHVMKMCEAFTKLGFETNLFTIKSKNLSKIYKEYNINYKFNIISVFNNFKKLNFLLRIIFSNKILSKNLNKRSLFVSRSIIFALVASILKKNVILELHHEITGISKLFYFLLKYLRVIKNLKFIFLHNELKKLYKISSENSIVLDDASNIKDFNQCVTKKLKNTCVYVGSFFEGKGIEQILRLVKKNPKVFFHIYGEKKYLKYKDKKKNLKIFDYVSYSKIPKVLSRYNVALMPYQKKVKGRASIWLEKYMSPLKMFDYMSAKLIILASDLSVYKHILKNNFNCKLIKVNDDSKWSEAIYSVLKNSKKNTCLKKNAYQTAKKYTWDKRCQKIISLSKLKI